MPLAALDLGVEVGAHLQTVLGGPIAQALPQFHRVVPVLDLTKTHRYIDVAVAEDLEGVGDKLGI